MGTTFRTGLPLAGSTAICRRRQTFLYAPIPTDRACRCTANRIRSRAACTFKLHAIGTLSGERERDGRFSMSGDVRSISRQYRPPFYTFSHFIDGQNYYRVRTSASTFRTDFFSTGFPILKYCLHGFQSTLQNLTDSHRPRDSQKFVYRVVNFERVNYESLTGGTWCDDPLGLLNRHHGSVTGVYERVIPSNVFSAVRFQACFPRTLC